MCDARQAFIVTVEEKNGTKTDTPFVFDFEARRFAREESKWENTLRVTCPALSIDITGDFVTPQRPDTITPRAVNFEFPLPRLSEALHYVSTHGLIEHVGLHLHATAQWANDAEVQCCATAWTRATDAQWHAFCQVFNQDCVALASAEFLTAWANGTNQELRASKEHGKTVGPTPWAFAPVYFIHPSAPRHIEG